MTMQLHIARLDISLPPVPWLRPNGPNKRFDTMISDITITREDQPTKARYVATVAGKTDEAEMTLSKVSDSLIIVDHTYVPDSLRGHGLAGALAQRLISDARMAGQRIVPLCPFFRGYAAKRKEELSDVVQW